MTELQNNLPHGWDCKVDSKTGKYYYVNHYTKTTTWEDPRSRHRPLQGTPKHFSNLPGQHIPLQDMKATAYRSPLSLRNAKVQDSSFSTASTIISSDPEDSVAKISAMFPTASETHIKLLLKNCRYMKSIFPNADETVILEVLQNNDANIQKTSELLKEMGYTKKDSIKPSTPKEDANNKKKKDEELKNEQEDVKVETHIVKMKTTEEKHRIKQDLQEKYKDVAEHLINIALESVNFDENRANQILQIMIQEDTEAENNNKNKKNMEESQKVDNIASTSKSQNLQIPISQSRQSIKSILKSQNEKKDETPGFSRVIDEVDSKVKSINLSNTTGHNSALSKGPNEKLLLENYVQWQGPNLKFRNGTHGLAKGPNKGLLSTKIYKACGPNSDLRDGPKSRLAKGSIFSQMKAVVLGENRVQ